jgi:heat shock protein HslJ
MKRIFLALPLAMLLVNCSTQHNTAASVNAGTSGSASASATTSMANSGSATANAGISTNSRYAGYDVNHYDPNNYMQNPEKYKSPRDLVKTGGWTYNTDWNQNTNFLSEALGQWLLQPTQEVAAFWIPDSSRADTYAAYWAPEAVAARQQAKMVAAAAYRDSVLQAQGLSNSTATASNSKMKNRANAISGSGSTGTMGSGGTSAAASTTSDNMNAGTTNGDANNQDATTGSTVANTKNYIMAVNGNMFQVPRLNLYLQNGTFVGYTGSNQLVGTLKVDGTQLHFDQTVPSTNMSATGGFSQDAFMERLGRVDSYDITDGQLRLKQGNQVLFVLAKNAVQ